MHELTLAFDLVDRIQEIMKKDGAKKAKSVSVTIGHLSGVDRGCFEFAFPEAAKGTCAQDAELIITESDDHSFQLHSLEVYDV